MLRFSLKDLFLWMIRKRRRFLVDGSSMLPTLRPGESLMVKDGYYKHKQPQIGDIVLLRHPNQDELFIVKRILKIEKEGVFLIGDNHRESTDSRHFGLVSVENLIAKVTSKI